MGGLPDDLLSGEEVSEHRLHGWHSDLSLLEIRKFPRKLKEKEEEKIR